jgi:subtilisin family serine protease
VNRTFVIVLALALAAPLTAEETQRYLVSTRGGSGAKRLRVAANAELASKHRVRAFRNIDAFAADLTAAEVAELQQRGDVILQPVVERFALEEAASTPIVRPAENPAANEPQTTPWGITSINAQQVWPVTRGENVHVAVLDSGVELGHSDLKHALQPGFNAFDAALPPADGYRHGTHVTGTIAAADNNIGVVGVAPGVKIYPVKVLDNEGRGTDETLIAGLDWVMEKAKSVGGRWVVNLSLGSRYPSVAEELAVRNAISQDIVVIAAAGNGGNEHIRYPARYDDVIAVGAVDSAGKRTDFSSYGVGLTLMAPGAEVRSTIIKGLLNSVALKQGAEAVTAWEVIGSGYGTITARLVDCAEGDPDDFTPAVKGQVALIWRSGRVLFREMVRNAREAGAAAVVIVTYPHDGTLYGGLTLYPDPPDPLFDNYPFLPTVAVLYETGKALINANRDVTVTYSTAEYATMNGTSMAAPHVAGAAALLLSLAPELSVAQVDYVLRHTARDIYDNGWDYETSWGVIDALAAARWVAPQRFGVPPPTPIPSPRRRSAGH